MRVVVLPTELQQPNMIIVDSPLLPNTNPTVHLQPRGTKAIQTEVSRPGLIKKHTRVLPKLSTNLSIYLSDKKYFKYSILK